MSGLMKVLATVLILSMASLTAVAQDDSNLPEEQEEVRRYMVELIVFSYAQDVSVGTEVFPPDKPIVDDTVFLDIEGPIESDLTGNQRQIAQTLEGEGQGLAEADREIVFLREKEFTLNDVAERFERLDVYEPIMHVGWTQLTHPEEVTKAIELWEFGDVPAGLDGSFTLYLSRYLHLAIDLSLDAPGQYDEPAVFDEPEIAFGDARRQFRSAREDATMPVRYRILDDRIFKNGEVRYFDHPKFGVVVKIVRVEEELEETEPAEPPSINGAGQ